MSHAAHAHKQFSGHDVSKVETFKDKGNNVFYRLGELAFVGYDTKRDGKKEAYIHRFKKTSRPQLAVSHDGKELRIIGGRFLVTERGIEDR